MSFDELWPSWRSEWMVYEDEDLVVVDKPAGVPTQPAERGGLDDARSRLASWLQSRDGGPAPQLGIMHGFDREASGLVVFSRRPAVNRALAAQLSRGVSRRYLVAVESLGALAHECGPHARGPESLSHQVLARRAGRMLVAIRSAARSQPIRRQLARLGAPIAGDRTNSGPPAARLMLHAAEMELEHPTRSSRMTFVAPEPRSFSSWLDGVSTDPFADDATLERLLREAADQRYAVATRPDTNVFRLANGRGDGLEGVTLDVYDEFLALTLTGRAARAEQRARILDALEQLGPRGIYLKLPPKQANVLVDAHREDVAPSRAVRGRDAPGSLTVREVGLSFEVRLADGLSTGLYVDQREGRRRVRRRAAGVRLLNLFGYTGAFTVAAVAGGASRTVTVDTSRRALAWAERNLRANGAEPGAHQLVRDDVGRWLQRAGRRGQRFDLIVLDPPSFSTTKHMRFRADKDYRALAAAAFRCLAPEGELLACTNHRSIVLAKLRRDVRGAAHDAGRAIERLQIWPPASDCPSPPGGEPHPKSILVTAN